MAGGTRTQLKTRVASDERLASYLAIDMGVTQPQAVAADGTPAAVFLAETLQALTPRLMQWSDGLWLLDLSACKSYWRARAAGTDGAVALIRELLQELLGRTCRAALADHPWQALLLARHMQERRLFGLVIDDGPFGDSFYRDVSWDTWWRCSDELSGHLSQCEKGRRRFDAALFRRQGLQMRRAVRRLGLATPWHLREVEGAAVKRRFGAMIRDMWQWAYGVAQPREAAADGCESTDALFDSGFPWRSFVFPSLPKVTRHLEEPLDEWQHMEFLLREDFDRLCGLSSWLAGEKVVSLEWRIVFRDLSHHAVPIRFRHPHSLHLEKGIHATALLQALYSFEATMLRRARSEGGARREREPSSVVTPVIAWDLIIKERLTIPRRSVGLFGDQTVEVSGTGAAACGTHAEMTLLQLENKLPIRLGTFSLREDWLPEDSFRVEPAPGGSQPRLELQAAYKPSLLAVARARPLYLYSRPVVYDGKGRSSLWSFSERTMTKWWHDCSPPDARSLQRDYYRLTDAEGRVLWVYKDNQGQSFVHGIFA